MHKKIAQFTQNFDPNKIKIDEKSYKNILIHCIEYLMVKNLSFVRTNFVILYTLLLMKNGYFKENNRRKMFDAITYR